MDNLSIINTKHMTKEQKNDFLQSKFETYKLFNKWLVVAAVLMYMTFFVSDCQICNGISYDTIIPRTIILAPMLLFLVTDIIFTDYRVVTFAAHFVLHCIIWCSICTLYYLPDRNFANEQFAIMHLFFLGTAFTTSYIPNTISHCMMLIEILISNTFIHYDRLDMIFSLTLPCIICISIINFVISQQYKDTYITKKQLESALIIDPLTGTYNRNILNKISTNGRLNFDRTGKVAVLLADIDFFKKINDTYGHEKGDVVLKKVATILQNCVRGNDYVIRWGGEEFVIFMPACTKDEAVNVAERIRQKICNTDNGVCPITISIGVADYNGENYEAGVRNADKALYVAKQAGRNRVIPYVQGSTTGILHSNGIIM